MSSIFISHSGKDRALAERVLAWLGELHHHSAFLDLDAYHGIRQGERWERALYRELRDCRAFIALVSESWVESKWCFAEYTHARSLGKLILPFRVGAYKPKGGLADTQSVLSLEDEEDSRARLELALAEARLVESFEFDTKRADPYPGLLTFEAEHAGVFFGRDREIVDCTERLRRLGNYGQARLLILLGASGSGKSSLVRAGLLPRLRLSEKEWLCLDPFVPGEYPVHALATNLARATPKKTAEVRGVLEAAASRDGADSGALLDLVDGVLEEHGHDGARLLVTIDQAEEMLGGDDRSVDFVRLLKRALRVSDGRLVALATMRSDHLGRFQRHPELIGFEDYDQMTLAQMPVERFPELIREPAARVRVEFEEWEEDGKTVSLADRIAADAKVPDALPLLAHTLRQLYLRGVSANDRVLELREYEDLGGIEGVIQKTATDEFKTLQATDEEKEAFFGAFSTHLVDITEEGTFVRRRALVSDLPEESLPIVRHFASSRCRLLKIDESEAEATVEVTHESLFENWAELRKHLEADKEFTVLLKGLTRSAEQWDSSDRRDDLLVHRGARLADIRELVKQKRFALAEGSVDRDYLDACEKAELERAESAQRIRRLSDLKRLKDLTEEADGLWPAEPCHLDAYGKWRKKADSLLANLDEHRSTRDALPENDDPEVQWWRSTLTELVDALESLRHGLIPDVERRLRFADSVEERSREGAEARALWEEARRAVAAHRCYDGLDLEPQLGLLPLGPDPESTLWEFAHLASGEVPERGPDDTLVLNDRTCIVLVLLPGDDFLMGAQSEDPGKAFYDPVPMADSPLREVSVGPFFLSKYQMTQGQWEGFTGANPSRHYPGTTFGDERYTLRNPVEQVSWNDCDRVLFRMGLVLPTEVQWEYGARAGTSTPWWTGQHESTLEGAANLSDQAYMRRGALPDTPFMSWDDGYARHCPVEKFRPNAFGLHNVHGNVWEWCADEYREGTNRRVFRGGSFYRGALSARSALRRGNDPDHAIDYLGVRPAREIR